METREVGQHSTVPRMPAPEDDLALNINRAELRTLGHMRE